MTGWSKLTNWNIFWDVAPTILALFIMSIVAWIYDDNDVYMFEIIMSMFWISIFLFIKLRKRSIGEKINAKTEL